MADQRGEVADGGDSFEQFVSGVRALSAVKLKVRELFGELFEDEAGNGENDGRV